GTFASYMLEKVKAIKELENEIQEMRNELIEMDEQEKDKKYLNKDCNTIHLFPIGYFQVPKEKTERCFEILNIDDKLKENLKSFFNQNIIPIINTYSIEIKREGAGNGKLEFKGVESYRSMYRIRKAFFENQFYKTDIGY